MWEQNHEKPRKTITNSPPLLADDNDGSATVSFLKQIQNVGRLVADYTYAGSLGLDQTVYSYGAKGNLHPTAFIACHRFALELKDKKKLYEFTTIRNSFEEFLVRHKHFINDLGHSKGSRLRSLESFLVMYRTIYVKILSGVHSDEAIVEALKTNPKLKDLKTPPLPTQDDIVSPSGKKKFSKTAERIRLLEDMLAHRQRCTECGARLPPDSRSKDHDKRRQDGGSGHSSNLVFTHPYCNSGFKESKRSKNMAGSGGDTKM